MNANKVLLIGKVTQAPSLSDNSIVAFQIATSTSHKLPNGDTIIDTVLHNIQCNEDTADVALKLLGMDYEVALEGSIGHNIIICTELLCLSKTSNPVNG
jgi:single-stranded DNA-binding protein